MAAKDELRRKMRQLRRSLSAAERARASAAICAQLLRRDDVRRAVDGRLPVAVYLASKDEADLSAFIAAALDAGAMLAAPRWNGETYALARLETVAAAVAGPYGILEPPASAGAVDPASVAVWLTPGLAFTPGGGRLGYGGGWYDRLLAQSAPSAAKLGIAFGCQVVGELPTEPHDRLLDAIVSG